MTKPGARATAAATAAAPIVVATILVAALTTSCGSSARSAGAPAPSTSAAKSAASPVTSSARATTAPAPAPAPSTTEAPKPFDPTKPIDLGGTPGVTPAEQHRAETLLRETIADLRRYQYPSEAYAAGYRSIGDGVTGDEHYVDWSLVNDGHILDPMLPESLVYEVRDGRQQIVAAMYMMPYGSRFADVPDVGGALTQWHVHDDLCFSGNAVQKSFAGFTAVNGVCPAGTTKAGSMPMLHVWVVPNPCGPFASLEGVGAGQVPSGQTRLCDTAHGSTS